MTVEHRRTGRQAELVSKDDTKVKVRYLDESIPEDKRDFEMTVSTYKRWWKPFEEEPGTALANEIANDFEAEEDKEQNLTDEEYAQIGKEIAEQAKEKAELQKSKKSKKVKSHRVSNPEVAQIVAEQAKQTAEEIKHAPATKVGSLIDKILTKAEVIKQITDRGLAYKTSETGRNISLYFGKKLQGVFYVGPKSVTFYFSNFDIKALLIEFGCEVKESKEKFDNYSRVNSNALTNLLNWFEV